MRSRLALAAGAAGLLLSAQAMAHGVAGSRLFVSTLLIDDPSVADEASLPTFFWLPQPAEAPGEPRPALYQLNVDISKRITENLAISFGDGYSWLRRPGQKTANGWQNVELGLKYLAYVSPEHEFMLSAGISREFARTGATGNNAAVLDIDDTSSTTPQLFFGKGLGDLPIGYLRPLAITGQFGFSVPDSRLKVTGADPDSGDLLFNNGGWNQWVGGLTVQYSMRYLQTQVKDFGLPEWVNRLTPLVEMSWSSPASKPNNGATQYLFGIGVNYTAESYALSVEALVPGNRATGSHMGIIAQLHLYFDDLFPTTLGKPISQWWQ